MKKQNLVFFCLFLLLQNQFRAHYEVSTVFGSSQGYSNASLTASKYKAPTGICISTDGNTIYLADYSGNRIHKSNPISNSFPTKAGDETSSFADGIRSNSKFSFLSPLTISRDKSILFVTNQGNFRANNVKTQTIFFPENLHDFALSI